MLLYLFLDLVFGFTILGMTKKCKSISFYEKKYDFMTIIRKDFEELQKKFKSRNIKLLISKTDEVNAYAIGAVRKKIVVLTLGIIAEYRKNTESAEEFHDSINSILAHEISHLLNKDYLPTMLLCANQKATNFVNKFILFFFKLIINIFHALPIIGELISHIILSLYKIIAFFINFFQKYIITKIFSFLKLHVSRNTEYRCDYQAALATGGQQTGFALEQLGDNGFVTIFSTHPRTIKRVKKVQNVQKKNGFVQISIINKISNFTSIALLLVIVSIGFDYINNLEYQFSMFDFKTLIEVFKEKYKTLFI